MSRRSSLRCAASGLGLALLLGPSPLVRGQGSAAVPGFGAVAREPAARGSARAVDLASFSAIAREPRIRSGDGPEWSLSTGFEISRGDFGGAGSTRMTYLPLALRYQRGAWLASLTVSYLRIDGPGDVVGGLESDLVVGRGSAGRTSERGLGDVVAGLAYRFDPETPGLPVVELGGRVKLPTADEGDGLGTGELDYTAQLELSKTLGRVTAFGALGYRVLGDPPGLELEDGFLGSFGLGYRFGPRWSGGLSYELREASTQRSAAPREVVPYAAYRWSEKLTFSSYGVFGLSDASPDAAWGFTARVAW